MKSLFASALLLVASVAMAQNVAYINMETVFNEYYKTISENIRFEEERQNFMTGMEVLRGEFENSRKEFQQAQADSRNDLLGDAAKQEALNKVNVLGARLEQKQEEILRYRQQAVSEMDSRQQSTTQSLVDDLQKQLEKYAAEMNYELVYEVSGRTMNRVPVLLVYPKDKEITDAVVKLVNAGHETEKAEAKAKLESLQKAAADKEYK
jgi:Skp family chaperone for outer membrane proteins